MSLDSKACKILMTLGQLTERQYRIRDTSRSYGSSESQDRASSTATSVPADTKQAAVSAHRSSEGHLADGQPISRTVLSNRAFYVDASTESTLDTCTRCR
jgi:hypothetical protein